MKKMKVAILLFNKFETLDVFGPVEILGRLPAHFEISYYSMSGGIISSTQKVDISTTKLEKLRNDESVDIFIIPGGQGTRVEIANTALLGYIKEVAQKSSYILTVCTGSVLLAKTGLLDGKMATSNKKAYEWVISQRSEVNWKPKPRWTVDLPYYTSSGISAGMDMTLGFIKDVLDRELAIHIADDMEYIWNEDSEDDKFTIDKFNM